MFQRAGRMMHLLPSEMLRFKPDNGAGAGGSATGSGGGQAGGGQAGEGSGEQPGAAGAQGGAAGAGDAMSLEQVQAELEKARKALKDANAESAGRRKRLEELEGAEAERERAKLSEVERAAKDAQAAQQKAQDLETRLAEMDRKHKAAVVQYEVKLQAAAMGIIDPDAAVKLLDWDTLEFGEDGAPKNVEAALKKLVAAKPYLVKAQGSSSGLGTPAAKPRQPATQQGTGVRRVTPL